MSRPADDDAAARRRVDAGDQVQQRRLARARRAHQRDELPFGDVEVDAHEDRDLDLVPPVDLLDAARCESAARPTASCLSSSFDSRPSRRRPFTVADAAPPARAISFSPPWRPCVISTCPWTSPPAVTGVNFARPSTIRKTPGLRRRPSSTRPFGTTTRERAVLALRRLGREADARREVRQHAIVGVEERDLHAHRRLLPVGRRNDLAQPAVVRLVRNGVERDLRRLVLRELREVGLVDVGADVERGELDERRRSRPPEPPPEGEEPNGDTASPTNARLAVITPANGARMTV